MPGEKRRIDPGLIDRLRDEPYRFEFFQAVRLLLAQSRAHSCEEDADVLGQTISFRSSVSLAFPPSEIESLDFEWENAPESDTEGCNDASGRTGLGAFKKVTMTPSFMGLTGPSGVLPRHYTQHVAEREIFYRDSASRAFFDIFTTRAVALFYQSWLKYRLHLQYEEDRKNCFLPSILSLAGLGLKGTRDRLIDGEDGIPDESLAYYSAALRQRPQSAQWFSRIAADYFQIRCTIEQFVGQWFELPQHELTRLGVANCVLGQTGFCGNRVWDRHTKLRLTIGPMRRDQFDGFLPGGSAFKSLRRLFRLMVGSTFDCEVRLVLDKRDIGAACLDTQSRGTRLGWNGWFKSRNIWTDASDTAYLIRASDPI
ncbi:type VI secretion system baseplate subunit TssG [Noviherbaspirillum sp.]|jgi:type VI secretion system protein ImpH|uniref:type VI secretion system baseplate subunit TssG n=1 Tax=Noviherbaspirillum sp. TaxID=1926288 RepID=UPI0025D9C997|nr:type VI secretion system baseplate subunit TssG [Noviherbaspirillum sp.]